MPRSGSRVRVSFSALKTNDGPCGRRFGLKGDDGPAERPRSPRGAAFRQEGGGNVKGARQSEAQPRARVSFSALKTNDGPYGRRFGLKGDDGPAERPRSPRGAAFRQEGGGNVKGARQPEAQPRARVSFSAHNENDSLHGCRFALIKSKGVSGSAI